jgi:battenin
MIPMPGAPSSSWARFRQSLSTMVERVDKRVVGSFWLFGEHPHLLTTPYT